MAAAGACLIALLSGATPTTELKVDVQHLRSHKGMIRICLTADPDNFPACVDDADATARSVPAGTDTPTIRGLPPGDYAIAVIHDENGNRKLDTFIGVPREGFGFSRNPPVGFGPPRFAAARFTLGGAGAGAGAGGAAVQHVRMRYLL